MSELARGGIVACNLGDRIWAEPEATETYIPLRFDSMGTPIYDHQLCAEGDDNNVIRGED